MGLGNVVVVVVIVVVVVGVVIVVVVIVVVGGGEGGGRGGGRGGGVYSQAKMLRGKPNSLSPGPVAGLLFVVREDYTLPSRT